MRTWNVAGYNNKNVPLIFQKDKYFKYFFQYRTLDRFNTMSEKYF